MDIRTQVVNKICIVPGLGTAIGTYTVTSNLIKTIIDIAKIIFLKISIVYYSTRKFLDKKLQKQEQLNKIKIELIQHLTFIGIGILRAVPVVGGFILYSHDTNQARRAARLQVEVGRKEIHQQTNQDPVTATGTLPSATTTSTITPSNPTAITVAIKDKIDCLKRKAAAGDGLALIELADLYFKGEEIDKSYEIAFKYSLEGAQRGHLLAMQRLMYFYKNRIGIGSCSDVEADYQFHFWRYESVLKSYISIQNQTKGFLQAQIDKAATHSDEKLLWLKRSAQRGFQESYFSLAELLDSRADYVEAMKYYLMAANKGNIEAMMKLVDYYMKGLGVDRSNPQTIVECNKQGLIWCQKAAQNNSASGQYLLGKFLLEGKIIVKNVIEGFKWCLIAAEQGLLQAKIELVWMLINGDYEYPINYKEGMKWIKSILADKNSSEEVHHHFIKFMYDLSYNLETNKEGVDPETYRENLDLAIQGYELLKNFKYPEAFAASNRALFKTIGK